MTLNSIIKYIPPSNACQEENACVILFMDLMIENALLFLQKNR